VNIIDELSNSIKLLKRITFDCTVKSLDINSHGNLIVGTIQGDIIYKEIISNKHKQTEELDVFYVTQGHFDGEITGLAIVDSTYFLTSGSDNRIILWNIDDRKCDKIAKINDIEQGQIMEVSKKEIPPGFPLNQQSECIAYSALIDNVAISIKNGSLSIREGHNKIDQRLFADINLPFGSYPLIMRYSPDSKYLATCNNDNSIYILNPQQKYMPFKTISGLISPGFHLDWDKQGEFIQVVSKNNDYNFFNIKLGNPLITNPEEIKDVNWQTITCKFGYYVQGIFLGSTDPNYINTVSCSKDRKYIISGDDDKLLNIYNFPVISESAKCKSFYGHAEPISNVTFTEDDKRVISIAGSDTSVIVWEFKELNKRK